MSDYIILALVALIGCGGLYLLHEAKKLNAKRDEQNHVPHHAG